MNLRFLWNASRISPCNSGNAWYRLSDRSLEAGWCGSSLPGCTWVKLRYPISLAMTNAYIWSRISRGRSQKFARAGNGGVDASGWELRSPKGSLWLSSSSDADLSIRASASRSLIASTSLSISLYSDAGGGNPVLQDRYLESIAGVLNLEYADDVEMCFIGYRNCVSAVETVKRRQDLDLILEEVRPTEIIMIISLPIRRSVTKWTLGFPRLRSRHTPVDRRNKLIWHLRMIVHSSSYYRAAAWLKCNQSSRQRQYLQRYDALWQGNNVFAIF
jgi:hypothetical protein